MGNSKKVASKKQAVKNEKNVVVDNKVANVQAEELAKQVLKFNKALQRKADKSFELAADKVLGLPAWTRALRSEMAKVDTALAEQIEANWAEIQVRFKMALDNVIVESKDKDGNATQVVKPVMWVRKTDKQVVPNYFAKAKLVSYRCEKKESGKHISVADGKGLEVVIQKRTPVQISAVDALGNSYTIDKKILVNGEWKVEYTTKDEIFVPIEQLTFGKAEIKRAWREVVQLTFGK